MTSDPFTDRLDKVRRRFVATLDGKIGEILGAVPSLTAAASSSPACVAEAYRGVHGVVGIGRTVGFPETGRAAREVEDVLRPPYRDGRGLSEEEISLLTKRLETLREVAARELQSAPLV